MQDSGSRGTVYNDRKNHSGRQPEQEATRSHLWLENVLEVGRGYKLSDCTSNNILSPGRLHHIPKWCHNLETIIIMYSDAWAYEDISQTTIIFLLITFLHFGLYSNKHFFLAFSPKDTLSFLKVSYYSSAANIFIQQIFIEFSCVSGTVLDIEKLVIKKFHFFPLLRNPFLLKDIEER